MIQKRGDKGVSCWRICRVASVAFIEGLEAKEIQRKTSGYITNATTDSHHDALLTTVALRPIHLVAQCTPFKPLSADLTVEAS